MNKLIITIIVLTVFFGACQKDMSSNESGDISSECKVHITTEKYQENDVDDYLLERIRSKLNNSKIKKVELLDIRELDAAKDIETLPDSNIVKEIITANKASYDTIMLRYYLVDIMISDEAKIESSWFMHEGTKPIYYLVGKKGDKLDRLYSSYDFILQ